MNSSRFALGLVGLALAGLWYAAGGALPVPASADARPLVAAPLTHDNLSVYFVYGADAVPDARVLTLQEALDRQLAVVHETSNVNVLAVENRSAEYELFIQSGDIVKGGKQDRMAAADLLLPPNSGVVPLPAHCVEQGRWTGRGAESAGRFHSSTQCAAGKDLKYANAIGLQGAVWQNVSASQAKLTDNLKAVVNAPASPTSFQLSLEAPALKAKVAEYEVALAGGCAGRDDAIGVVFVVNGQVTGAEVYGSNALFRKAWPKLLNAAAVEAIAERTEKAAAVAPSTREVERYLASAASPQAAAAAESPGLLSRNRMVAAYGAVDSTVLGRSARANANEEVFQTEGRGAQTFQTEGRAPQPEGNARPGQFVLGGRVNSDAGLAGNLFVVGGGVNSDAGLAGNLQNRRNGPDDVPNPAGAVRRPDLRAYGSYNVNGPGTRLSAADNGAAAAAAPSADGNRLNSNRIENASNLVVESRDPTRQNAVIHRSYITK